MTQIHLPKTLIALGLGMMLTGCQTSSGSSNSPVASPVSSVTTAEEPAEPALSPSAADEERFFAGLEASLESDEERAIHDSLEREQILDLALSACADFDQGRSFDQVAQTVVGDLQQDGLSGDNLEQMAYYSGKAIGAGVFVFCPQHSAQITGEESESNPTAGATDSTPTSARTAEEATPENADSFFASLERVLSDDEQQIYAEMGEASALELAQTSCQQMDAGKPFDQVAEELVVGLQEAGLEGDELQQTAVYSGKVIGAGVAIFCPQHLDQLS